MLLLIPRTHDFHLCRTLQTVDYFVVEGHSTQKKGAEILRPSGTVFPADVFYFENSWRGSAAFVDKWSEATAIVGAHTRGERGKSTFVLGALQHVPDQRAPVEQPSGGF